jgi:hypothetical protein
MNRTRGKKKSETKREWLPTRDNNKKFNVQVYIETSTKFAIILLSLYRRIYIQQTVKLAVFQVYL